MCADHQGSRPGLPPEDGLPVLRRHEGSVLWLVCPGGKVSHCVWMCTNITSINIHLLFTRVTQKSTFSLS